MPQSELIRPVHALLRAHAEHAPGRTAFRDAHRSVDYRRLDERTARIATGLAETVGVEPGDRVLICLGNGVTMVEAYLAVARASAVGVPVNPLSMDPELAHFLTDSGARAVITDPSHVEQIRRVADPSVRVVVTGEGDEAGDSAWPFASSFTPSFVWSFEALAAGADAPRDRLGLDEPAFMLYTSGTTGRPKGVVSSVRNSLWTIAACYAPLLGLSGEDRVLWPLPLHHCLGHHLGTLGTLAVGASTYVTSGFAPEEILGELRGGDYTFLAGVPAMYQQLLTAARDEPGLGGGLRMCLTAGAVGSAALRTEFEDHFGVPLLDSYGTTETCGPITANTPDGERVPGSCGRPVPGLDVRLVDPRSGEEGDAGEVWVRGPNVMAGYHGRPDATAEVLVDGWYRTGDLATRAGTGHLTISGRLSELIVRGGENVYPAELDEVLRGVPELADAAVAGRADEVLGEVPVAYVVPRGEGLDADAVLRYCRGRLAAYKVPVEIRVVEAIPRTASGKVARHLLAGVGARLLSGVARGEGEGRGEGKGEVQAGWCDNMSDRASGSAQVSGPDPARAAVLRERLHPLSAGDRHAALLDLVREETARVLDAPFAEVGSRRPFREMGLTSVNAVALRDALVGRTGCELRATVVFDHPTPGALARLLGDELGMRSDNMPANLPVAATPTDDDPVVIVSMSCRYPGDVTTPEALWRLVRDGVDASGDFPDDRGWDTDALYDPDPERTGHTTTRRGGFLRGAGEFDNELFGISPREALAMDPQQRLLLELAWETLERAGIAPDALHGESVGVFTGVMRHEYGAALDPLPPELEGYLDLGKLGSVASGRIAYALGLHGPALTVDTACSSSLVALHLAVRALRAGECTMALAGAATVMATPQLFVEFSRQRALSPDGRCRAFSADADGTGWAEGAGLLLLERLSDARRGGHPVLAVVRGSALNSDGASNGLTAPNGKAQQAVIRLALADAGLTPDGVDAVEAHGTATRLGDPIEAHALAATYGAGREHPLWLGSLKSNIGHTQAAAGVGGVIKTVLALAAGELPPTLHAERPSTHVDWHTSGLALLTEARPWPETGDRPRRAAVSAFGISGTNAHVILEQAPADDAVEGGRRPLDVVPLPLSARTEDALRAQAQQIAGLGLDGADLGLSLATTRAALDQRAVVIGDSTEALTALAEGQTHPALVTGVAGEPGAVAFVFPGQGSQWPGMASRLLETSPVFREAVTACSQVLDEHLDFAVLDVLTEAEGAPPLERAEVVQPALFAVMVALARTWESLGVRPSAVIGHSQGELAAVHIAGGLDLADAARIVALRSKALRAAAGLGGMASVPLPAAEVTARLGAGLAVAAVNGPRSTVISGDADALAALVDAYQAEGVRARRIPVDYASHCAHMDQLQGAVLEIAARTTPRPSGTVRFYSTVTGTLTDTATLTPAYWFDNLRQPVRFQDALEAMLADGHRVFVESSPHPVLAVGLAEILEQADTDGLVTGSLRRGEDSAAELLAAAARLWVRGVPVDWSAHFTDSTARTVPLPTYPFQRRPYWLAQRGGAGDLAAVGLHAATHPLLGAVAELPDGSTVFTARLDSAAHTWLADHAVSGTVLLPGAALVELAAHQGRITDLTLTAPAVLGDHPLTLRAVTGPADDTGARPFTVHTRPDADTDWTTHATGTLGTPTTAPVTTPPAWPPTGDEVPLDGVYDRLADQGYEYGPAFQGLRRLWRDTGVAYAEAQLPDVTTPGDFLCHPALLDAAFQAIAAGGLVAGAPGATPLPFSFEGVHLHATTSRELRVRVRARSKDTVELTAWNPDGHLVAHIDTLTLRARTTSSGNRPPYRVDWLPVDPTEPTGIRTATVGTLDVPGAQAYATLADATAHDLVLTALSAAHDPETTARQALLLAQEWLTHDDGTLVLVTRQALDDPTAAPAWGILRTATTEHPGRFALLDLDGTDTPWDQITSALHEGETQLAVRDGALLAARLKPAPTLPIDSFDHEPWLLEVTGSGSLDDLAPTPAPHTLRALAPGEVRIAVRAAGVNFRDVLLALGMVEVADDVLGGEGAGVVLETGPGVTELAVGQRVFGVIHGSFGPVAVADARMLAPVPDGWTFAEAAGVPIAWLTAWHGLFDIAGLKAGERVLIHSAAGGVGSAAVALARHAGAEVFATAAPGKHDRLRALGIPDDHLASSRDLEFESKFGRVDVVLNSLAGEFTDASLRLLGPGGRFVEMGKTDIRDAETVASRQQGVRYRAFDLLDAGPERIGEMFAELLATDVPKTPHRAWDIRHAHDAFRHMAAARHTGKVVLTLPRRLDPDGTVLVTGGTGTLGRLVARHLVTEHGVRNLLLVSRSGGDPELGDLDAEVTVAACDTADRDALAALLDTIPADRPLTAVVHAAGVLDDATVQAADPDRLPLVFAPKTRAAWHLHELTLRHDLAAFVLFSSIAGVLGGAGQAGYAAANVSLDALAVHRRALGLPAVSVAWGMWAPDSGMTGHLTQADRERLARSGVLPMDPEFALGLLDEAMTGAEPALTGALLDVRAMEPVPPLLRALATTKPRTRRTNAPTGQAPTSLDEAIHLVRTAAAAVLGHSSVNAVPAERAFSDQGFDSLTAVELRNRLRAATGLRLPTTVVFEHPTPAALAAHLIGAAERPATPTPVIGKAVDGDDPIAIVGMACRFPGGADTPEELWRLVDQERDVVGPFPTDRGWDPERLFDPDPDRTGTSYVREGAFLHGAGDFDAAFFGISPREALAMDPQQRLLLETAWETFEDAGIDPAALKGTPVAVYAGQIHHDYIGRLSDVPGELEGYLGHGTAGSVASGRIAYTFGLEGPAVTVDTACSSSLVALHLAVRALRAGECTMALAGGVSVMAAPTPFVEFSRQRGLAPDGRCKPFADAADGTGWSEGVGLLLVERLSDARRLGHRVLALVRGTAVNQDGASNGLTAPSGPAQQRVIRAALADARLSAADVQLVEAHGTGTRLGDPIEAQALLATYGAEHPIDDPLWLGSVKSNLGHAQAAAGVAGLVKLVMAMRNERMPRTLHVDKPSRHVDWSSGGVCLLTEARAWDAVTRRCGISSFGVSGTNAHVILEEAPATDTPEPGEVDGPVPLLLSARDANALRTTAGRLGALLDSEEAPRLPDTARELLHHRARLDHRAVVLGDHIKALATLADGRSTPSAVTGTALPDVKTVFVFPGQGAQWAGMARELLDQSPVFARRMAECGQALAPHTDWNLDDVVRDGTGLERVDVVQPVLFAVMVSLAALWEEHGVRPDAVLGHSQGEIAAACVSGALTLDDAARVVALRSRAITALAGTGGMLSVGLPAEAVIGRVDAYGERVAVAAVNGPHSVVLAGEGPALDELAADFTADGARVKRIPVDYASHTRAVESLRDVLERDLAPVRAGVPAVPMLSAFTGEWVGDGELDGGYWYANLRGTVAFQRATEALLAAGYTAFVEVSPHPVLLPAIGETAELVGADTALVATLRREDGGTDRFLTAAAEAYVRGIDVNWAALLGPSGNRVDLPSYPFQRQRYWAEQPAAPAGDDRQREFWDRVKAGDTDSLAAQLGLDGASLDALRAVLPALASWHQGDAGDALRYRVNWQPVTGLDRAARLDGRWLAVVPEGLGLGGLLGGAEVLEVSEATTRQELAARLGPADGVVSLLALGGREDGGLGATLRLLQALGDAEVHAPVWLVTRGAVAVRAGETVPSPAQAAVWGLGRVVAAERPESWGGLIDLPANHLPANDLPLNGLPADDLPADAVQLPLPLDDTTTRRLLATLAGATDEDEIALRPDNAWTRRLRPAPPTPARREWKPTGTALVTGGETPVGRLVAEWLTENGAESVVLLTTDQDSPGILCDTADETDLREVLAGLPPELPLRTVVHTAGILDDATIDTAEEDRARRVLRSRAGAALALDRVTRELAPELDAFVLFSSLGGTLGAAGHATYAPGHAVLDALAAARRAEGLPATAVAWGHWAVTEEAGGTTRPGVRDLDPRTGLAALRKALERDDTTVAVCDVDWAVLAGPVPPPLLGELAEIEEVEGEGAEALMARLGEADGPGRRRLLTQLVLDLTAEVLRHGDSTAVDPRRGFREQGFDSLAAVQFRNRLCAVTGLALPVTTAFDHPSPRALADLLLAELTQEEPESAPDHVNDVEAASDDELLELLASEFGIS